MHIAVLLNTSKGCPNEVTRVLPVVHCAITHGGKVDGMPGQPITLHGSGSRQLGMPLSITLGLGTVGMAWPPCVHMTVAPCWMSGPGMRYLP
jgi:hypothetical protein